MDQMPEDHFPYGLRENNDRMLKTNASVKDLVLGKILVVEKRKTMQRRQRQCQSHMLETTFVIEKRKKMGWQQ